jgi:hypothetical protein
VFWLANWTGQPVQALLGIAGRVRSSRTSPTSLDGPGAASDARPSREGELTPPPFALQHRALLPTLMGPVDETLCAVTGAGSTRGRGGSVAGARLSRR